VTEAAEITVRLAGGYVSTGWAIITHLKDFKIILGMPWLEEHELSTYYKERKLVFDKDYCRYNCLEGGVPVTAVSRSAPASEPTPLSPAWADHDIAEVSAYEFDRLSRQSNCEVYTLTSEELNILATPANPNLNAFLVDDKQKFIDKLATAQKRPSMEDIKAQLPECLHDLSDAFDPREADRIPGSRPGLDHKIKLVEGALPPYKKAYGLSRETAEVIKAYIDDMLAKGHIRRSTSEYASNILVVKKPGGGLRVCVDYRALNALTVKSRAAPPFMRDTLNRLS
jgi:hypothetical protein